MHPKYNASVARIAGLLLVLGGAAQANEADDTIYRLVAPAREQARAGNLEELQETIGEIVDVLPNASLDGVSAASEQDRYLTYPGGTERSQGTSPATTSESGGSPLQPVQEPRAPQLAKPAGPSPPELPPTPAPAPLAVPAEAPQTTSNRLIDLLRHQGDTALGTGDISGARRFFGRGAEAGCGACAEALARTYDADQLRRMGAVGIKPDPAQAEAWRARARQLGRTGVP